MAESQRVAIVTGASQGIGAGIVEGFRSAGYAVVGTSRSIRASDDPDLLAVPGDIAEPETAQLVVEQALDHFGRIDTLVNNAGIFMSKPFTEYTAEDFAAVIGVNLAGFFQITQRVVEPMASQGGGHIVNITTTLVDEPDRERPAALVALTKGGLAAVTRALAAEYATRGVRVNAVAPGVIQTSGHDPASYDAVSVRHPIGQVSDVVDAILYLEHAPYVTGETLRVDGGWATGH